MGAVYQRVRPVGRGVFSRRRKTAPGIYLPFERLPVYQLGEPHKEVSVELPTDNGCLPIADMFTERRGGRLSIPAAPRRTGRTMLLLVPRSAVQRAWRLSSSSGCALTIGSLYHCVFWRMAA